MVNNNMTRCPTEDRFALEDLITGYCLAVDKLSDVDALVSIFTPDAVCDFSGIGLPSLGGAQAIREFFDRVFADMTHHAHYSSNFAVLSYEGDLATIGAYIIGMGRARDGGEVLVHVRYRLDCLRTAQGWKCRRFFITPLMPVSGALEANREIYFGAEAVA